MTRAAFISLGCFKNQVDSEIIAAMLAGKKISIVSEDEPFDVLLINTCGFIHDAKKESLEEISAAIERKQKGEFKKLVVFGCLVQRYYHQLKHKFQHIDLFWGVNDFEDLAQAIASDQPVEYQNKKPFLQQEHPRILFNTSRISFLKISEGCSQKCSFCAIPLIRGRLRSRSITQIVSEAENLLKAGVQEINIISQCTTSFGKDLSPQANLTQLLKEISRLGFKWIRVLYLMPEEVNEKILAAFNHQNILPYFDLPFQHVAPSVLKKMHRGGGFEHNLKLIAEIRKAFPDAVFRTSLITGFPSETEDDFKLLLAFLKESKIERCGIFPYSDEEDTAAFKLKSKVAAEIVEERVYRLQQAAARNLQNYNKKIVASYQEFLPFAPSPWRKGYVIGRIASQAPEIDGWTEAKIKFSTAGGIKKIKISSFENEVLYGE